MDSKPHILGFTVTKKMMTFIWGYIGAGVVATTALLIRSIGL